MCADVRVCLQGLAGKGGRGGVPRQGFYNVFIRHIYQVNVCAQSVLGKYDHPMVLEQLFT